VGIDDHHGGIGVDLVVAAHGPVGARHGAARRVDHEGHVRQTGGRGHLHLGEGVHLGEALLRGTGVGAGVGRDDEDHRLVGVEHASGVFGHHP
jgi:hypothetical protein